MVIKRRRAQPRRVVKRRRGRAVSSRRRRRPHRRLAHQTGGGAPFPVFIGRSWQRGGGLFTPVVFSGQTFQRGGGAAYPIGSYRYGYIKRRQRGDGLGSFFKSLWRTVAPVVKPFASNTLKEIGRAAAQTGLQYGSRLLDGETSLKQSGVDTLKDFAKQAGQIALKQAKQQVGMGRRRRRVTSHAIPPLNRRKRRRTRKCKVGKRVYKRKRSTVRRRKLSRAKLFGY
jgi:hypothetical protein